MIIELDRLEFINNPAKLCAKPYSGHPKGCPNLGKKSGCPPTAARFTSHITPSYFAIINEFDLALHVSRLREKHPQWTIRQLECCLYWQPRARKELRKKTLDYMIHHQGIEICMCPEAEGIDVTHTLAHVGVYLEWPPKRIVRQVVIGGNRK